MTNEDFKLIVEQYEKLVFSICLQFTKDYQEAENLAQDTFLSAYRYIDSCDSTSYRPWLCRIAANKAKDYLKSAAHRKLSTMATEDLPEGVSLFPQPEEACLVGETVENIRRAVEGLKEPYRLVSELYFLQELSYEEIAQKLGRPKKTVQTQILRARTKLQEHLKGGT